MHVLLLALSGFEFTCPQYIPHMGICQVPLLGILRPGVLVRRNLTCHATANRSEPARTFAASRRAEHYFLVQH